MAEHKLHVLHIPLSLPLVGRPSAGTYIVDLVADLQALDNIQIGLLHINIISVFSALKNKFANRLKKSVLPAHVNCLAHDRYTLLPTPKRRSNVWVDYVVDAVDIYIKRYGRPDIVHCHSGRGAGVAGLAIKRKHGIPYVVQEHNPVFLESALPEGDRLRLQAVYGAASKICPVSSAMIPTILTADGPSDAIRVTPNLISPLFEVEQGLDHQGLETLNITVVARLDKNKNVQMAINAFALACKGRQAQLNIVGIGDLQKSLEGLAQKLGIAQHVVFWGYREKQWIAQLLNRSDVLLLQTNIESFGIPVLEALFCGCPVIATRCGGPEEIARHTDGITLIERGDADAMAVELSRRIQNPLTPQERKELSDKAKAVYGGDAICHMWQSIYKEVSDRGRNDRYSSQG